MVAMEGDEFLPAKKHQHPAYKGRELRRQAIAKGAPVPEMRRSSVTPSTPAKTTSTPTKATSSAGTAKAAAGGAAAGSAAGGIIGALGESKLGATGRRKARKARIAARTPARQLVVTEFVLCVLIIALSPLTDKHKQDSAATMMKRMTAISLLFLILGLVATGGRGAAKVASAFGGLVTVVLVVSERDVFTKIAEKMNSDTNAGPAGPSGPTAGESTGADNPAEGWWNNPSLPPPGSIPIIRPIR